MRCWGGQKKKSDVVDSKDITCCTSVFKQNTVSSLDWFYQTRHSNRFRHSVAVFRFYQTRLRPPELRFGVQTRHFLLEWRVTASLAGEACQRACLVKVKTATTSATQDCCHVIGTVRIPLRTPGNTRETSRTGSGGSGSGKQRKLLRNRK